MTPVLGRSPGEGNGYPLQYSGLENSMDCIVQGVVKSRTGLSYFHFTVRIRPTFTYHTVQVPKPQNGSGLKYGDNEKKVELEKKKKKAIGWG